MVSIGAPVTMKRRPRRLASVRAVGGKQGRELALVGEPDVIVRPGGGAVEAEPQRIVAQRILQPMRQAGVGPMEAESGELDAVAPRLVRPRPCSLRMAMVALVVAGSSTS